MLLLFFFVGSYEELLSRGYHIKNLSEGLNLKKRNPTAAILSATLISSAVFSLLHVFNPNATWVSTLCIVLSGLFLAAGYILTGDLALSIGIHTAWNFFQGNVFGFPVSGRNAGVTLLAIEQRGPDLITGGQFGPESGLIGIAAILLGCGILVLYVRRHYGRAGLRTELAVPNFQTKHLAKTSDSQKDAAQGTTDNVRKDKI
jgi:membrane protease YdiL (CAAX protease family)